MLNVSLCWFQSSLRVYICVYICYFFCFRSIVDVVVVVVKNKFKKERRAIWIMDTVYQVCHFTAYSANLTRRKTVYNTYRCKKKRIANETMREHFGVCVYSTYADERISNSRLQAASIWLFILNLYMSSLSSFGAKKPPIIWEWWNEE